MRLLNAVHFAVPQLVAAGARTLNSGRSTDPNSCRTTSHRQLWYIESKQLQWQKQAEMLQKEALYIIQHVAARTIG